MSATPVVLAVVEARAAHIEIIAKRAREADRLELWRGWRHTPEYSLAHGLRCSSHVWTGMFNLQPACMFGVVPSSLLGGSGAVWMIGTDTLVAHQMTFLRHCRGELARLQLVYRHLWNFVADDNTLAKRWLAWLGFHLFAPQPFGFEGFPFRFFEWRANNV